MEVEEPTVLKETTEGPLPEGQPVVPERNEATQMNISTDYRPQVPPHMGKKKKKSGNTKTKQTYVCEVGKDGKTQLTGRSGNMDGGKNKTDQERNMEYYLKFAQERRRPNEFRCNFTFNLELHETGNETRLETVLRLYKRTAQDIGIMDPLTVFQPWIPAQVVATSNSNRN